MMLKRPPLPIALLILLTIATLCGPLALALVLRGGVHQEWPPDRPIEWWTLGLVSAAVVILMVATIAAGLVEIKTQPKARQADDPSEGMETRTQSQRG